MPGALSSHHLSGPGQEQWWPGPIHVKGAPGECWGPGALPAGWTDRSGQSAGHGVAVQAAAGTEAGHEGH